MNKKVILLSVVLSLLLGGGYYVFAHRNQETTDNATIQARIVPLIPKVPGYIVAVHVDDNQPVRKGDLLIEIEAADYQIRVDRAAAALAALEARSGGTAASLETAQTTADTSVAAAEANIHAAEAEVDRAANELKRLKGIGPAYVSRKQMDEAIAADRDARARLADARAQRIAAGTGSNNIRVAQSTVGETQSLLAQARADLAAAQHDLDNTRIYAAADGVITRKTAEAGAYVQTGQMVGALVPHERWVVANFKETQITRMQPGQSVRIRVDAYPDLELTGKIDSLQQGTGAVFSPFPPENATGNFVKIVQRVPVKIVIDGPLPQDRVLGAGMSVHPTVYLK